MGLEGAVRLGYRNELAAIADPAEREATYRPAWSPSLRRAARRSTSASVLEIDDVIDPAETRRWIMRGLRTAPKPPARQGKKRPHIETW